MPHVRFNHLEEEVEFTPHDPQGPRGPVDLDKLRAAAQNFRIKQGLSIIDEKGDEVTIKEQESKWK